MHQRGRRQQWIIAHTITVFIQTIAGDFLCSGVDCRVIIIAIATCSYKAFGCSTQAGENRLVIISIAIAIRIDVKGEAGGSKKCSPVKLQVIQRNVSSRITAFLPYKTQAQSIAILKIA